MHKFENVSVALFAAMLVVAPMLAWAVLTYRSLEATGLRGGWKFTLRWVLTHMIEEYARHNGHADLLRERIDGVTGE